ncbi:MAG: TetR/AcrR family transcriptional regulator [Bacteroidales bacterium]|nr:TetR/AcrR family transcriptional regulator [Bacteroidales bacterium]
MHTDRQNQIIEESIKLIHTQGIQGMTIKNISNAIGLTEAAIYRHFKSKDEILSTILDDFRLNLETKAQSLLASNLSAKEALDNLLNHMVDMFCAKPFIVSVIFSDEIFKNKQKLSNKITQLIKQNNEYFRLIVEGGQKNKEIRTDIDANELAIIIMGSFRMVIKNWQLSKQVYSLKLRGQELFAALFKIISIK